MIALFLFVSYLAFSTSRKAEQNQMWVGMAKETASVGYSSVLLASLAGIVEDERNEWGIYHWDEKICNDYKLSPTGSRKLVPHRLWKRGRLSGTRFIQSIIYNRTSDQVSFHIDKAGKRNHAPMNVPLFWMGHWKHTQERAGCNGGARNHFHIHYGSTPIRLMDINDIGKGFRNRDKTIF